jgi:hypothetical protein
MSAENITDIANVNFIRDNRSKYCHVLDWHYRRGFGLDIGFIDHFNTRLVTIFNYSSITNFHTLQITKSNAKSFPACGAFTSIFLVTASNNGYSSASRLMFSLYGGPLPTLTFANPTKSSQTNLPALTLSLAYNISARTT